MSNATWRLVWLTWFIVVGICTILTLCSGDWRFLLVAIATGLVISAFVVLIE